MNRWVERKTGQFPRKGEVIMGRYKDRIYQHALIAEGPRRWWWYEPDKENLGMGSGTLCACDMFTHWTLLESPY